MAVLSKARLQPLLTKMLNFSSYTYFPFKSLLRENIKRLFKQFKLLSKMALKRKLEEFCSTLFVDYGSL